MDYEHPLPAGLDEPDPQAVKIRALETLIRSLLMEWPEERVKTQAEYYAAMRIGGPGNYAQAKDPLRSRADEVASNILWDVWLARQQDAEYQSMRDGSHFSSPPTGED